jgi:hypothetical protein
MTQPVIPAQAPLVTHSADGRWVFFMPFPANTPGTAIPTRVVVRAVETWVSGAEEGTVPDSTECHRVGQESIVEWW